MKKIGDTICKNRFKILILTLILLVPSLIGMITTKVNYDILVYLPEDIETIKGQDILTNDFNMGGFSVSIIDNMKSSDILKLEEEIKKIEGVEKVITSYDLLGTTIPIEILPEDIINKLRKGDSDLMLITFKNGTSSEETLSAVEEIKKLTKEKSKIGGMSAMVLDTMNLSETEILIYIIIAVILCIIVLEISLDSVLVPFLLLINIGISLLFNLGTNIIFGEISYITKALVAVLQLGVTTDFSIFLYHSYENAKKRVNNNLEAMSEAIHETFTSVVGSSLTTIAGFLVLCTMKLTLGTDLGLVMAKGVFLGVVCVLTVFPSLILISEKLIEKTKHKTILPNFTKLNNFIIKHNKAIFVIFLILIIPAYLAYSKVDVYYKLDESLPKDLDSIVANEDLKEKFNIVSPEIILTDKNISNTNLTNMLNEIENLEGIDFVLSFNKLESAGLSKDLLSENIINIFESDKYQMILINSLYEIASDELNTQVEEINNIIDKYDEKAILAGEGPLMKDLVSITDTDFKNVNVSSIIFILIIMLFVLKSLILPILLILVIEFAIFINMSIPYFSGLELPFVAPIVLGTIQLGATIDYAILFTTTYLRKRKENKTREISIKETLDTCINSVLVSGLCFFGATFGVGVYSELEMISSLCTLISRGAIISMIVVIFVLPSVLLTFDNIIMRTTSIKKKVGKKKMKNKLEKLTSIILLLTITSSTLPLNALVKDETVYGNLNNDGTINNIFVNTHLINEENSEEIIDETDLLNILNINGKEKFVQNGNELIWEAKGNDIYYKGTTEKELPIKLNIKYYLNNEEKSLKDILGKSGNIKINIKYTNTDSHKVYVNGRSETLFTPFLVTTGLIITGENNKNVNVNNGKVINNGINNIVVGLSTPGLYESLKLNELKKMDEIEITFDTNKFELPNIYSCITPKLIESEDLKIFDKMDDLYGNVNLLKSSIDEIENGVKSLLSGSNEIKEGTEALYGKLANVSEALENLSAGSSSLNSAIEELINALFPLESLLSTINIEELEELIIANEQTLSLLNIDADNNEQLIYLITNNNKVLINISNMYNTLVPLMSKLRESLPLLANGSKQISDGTSELSIGVKLISEKTKELSNGTNTLYLGLNELSTGINKFNNEGITPINNYINDSVMKTQNRITSLIKLGENYQRIEMNKNIENETKYILNIKGVKTEEQKVTKTKEKEKTTLWTRIKNLFK